MMQAKALFLAAVIAFPAWAGGDASDGHTHAGPAPAPVPVTASAPRAVTATEDFEVVAVLEGKHLVVYVDRYASNEPVAGAKVEVEGAGLQGVAAEAAPGVYLMNLAAALPPAKHGLTISIEAGDSADLLTATLDTSLAAPVAAHAHYWSEWVVWGLAALLLIASGILLAVRRRKQKGL
ncbi:MAG: hypothetical protein Q8M11_08905 [Sulfuritalea sp.]|jgi:hypothetical protein|nr:hypothetical protein [Sulfuritalea sp.]MDP1982684.1 hypothetical protein [Sulfuritalea sp.]